MEKPTGKLCSAGGVAVRSRLFAPGRRLVAEVVSVYLDRAVLAFGDGVRIEVAARAPLREGERVILRVERARNGAVVLRLAGDEAGLDRLV
ncbi:hypothetical protein STH2939 [Symbiobacterium thermophilum IAM 14863]|uniref:S1 motif domain-containing protein n=1 Tax=Symbiobacterium thermophilum (strain DSM 24528 / JCM 14929 / IAM 14863 / T) TaxID=292459 RepID=Q67K76_SYMTH|nr:hypothetical protein STH2939 [Symbiobacterium thermophilum IAM 14863]